jgi:hypothetical protein
MKSRTRNPSDITYGGYQIVDFETNGFPDRAVPIVALLSPSMMRGADQGITKSGTFESTLVEGSVVGLPRLTRRRQHCRQLARGKFWCGIDINVGWSEAAPRASIRAPL